MNERVWGYELMSQCVLIAYCGFGKAFEILNPYASSLQGDYYALTCSMGIVAAIGL